MTDDAFEYLSILSSVSGKFSTILISFFATKEKIKDLERIEWFDEELSRWENKERMKQTGGSMNQISEYLHESTILITAKAIEDFTISLNKRFNIKWHVFKNSPEKARFEKEVKLVRALNNIIKHNQSILDKSSSKSANFLVEECNLPDDTPIKFMFGHYDKADYSLQSLVCKSKVYCVELLSELLNAKNPYENISDNEIESFVVNQSIPEVLDLKKYAAT